jgi:hypothetical protein
MKTQNLQRTTLSEKKRNIVFSMNIQYVFMLTVCYEVITVKVLFLEMDLAESDNNRYVFLKGTIADNLANSARLCA